MSTIKEKKLLDEVQEVMRLKPKLSDSEKGSDFQDDFFA